MSTKELTDNLNAWATDDGFVESYEGTIEEARFDYDPEYRDGETPQLYLELDNVTTEEDVDLDDTATLRFGVGNGWEVVDNGSAVERDDGKNKGFHPKTRVGILIDRLIEIGAVEAIAARGLPTEAKVWEGLRFRFERHTEDYGQIDGENVKVDFMLPAELIGEESKASSNGNGSGNKAVRAKLVKLAKNAASHDDFLDAALDIDGVTDDDELFAAVSDDSEAGFYASAA